MANLVIVNSIILWIVGQNTKKVAGTIRGCPTTSGATCIDENTFALCDTDGLLTSNRYSCAIGSICSENSVEICKPLYKTSPPSCDENCGKCHTKKRYACIGRTKFALCLNRNYPSGRMYSCPRNTVCSTSQTIKNQEEEFCQDELLVVKPDCC